MSDYHRTLGFQKDKAQLFALLERIAVALERLIPIVQDEVAQVAAEISRTHRA